MLRSILIAVLIGWSNPACAWTMDGQWILAVDRFGTNEYSTLDLRRNGTVLSGDWDGAKVTGSVRDRRLTFSASDRSGALYRFEALISRHGLAGVADYPDHSFANRRLRFIFSGRHVPDRPKDRPGVVSFKPSVFSNSFSADRAPVLTLWPGDTLRTETIDSGGVDAAGQTRALFGNPQTGPFFVAGASPGDTLAVHIVKLELNRDWADSLDTIVPRALGASLATSAAGLGKTVRWRLDRSGGFATPENATGRLKGYRVPLRPMLGGLGLASGFGSPPMSTGDTGRAGGNMDFPAVAEGSTVYLPVQQPGALLYLGDAHALQGDGETSQYALETSMDVTIRVELIKGRKVSTPRVETATELMVLGQAGSLDDAVKAASSGLIQWLQQDYALNLSEAAQVIGTSIRFSIPNLAGRSVGVAARIEKARLPAQPGG